jgi:hypothetical protein
MWNGKKKRMVNNLEIILSVLFSFLLAISLTVWIVTGFRKDYRYFRQWFDAIDKLRESEIIEEEGKPNDEVSDNPG